MLKSKHAALFLLLAFFFGILGYGITNKDGFLLLTGMSVVFIFLNFITK